MYHKTIGYILYYDGIPFVKIYYFDKSFKTHYSAVTNVMLEKYHLSALVFVMIVDQ